MYIPLTIAIEEEREWKCSRGRFSIVHTPITPKPNNSCGVISCERLVASRSRKPHPPPKTTRGNISHGTWSIPNGRRFTQHNTSSEWCPLHPSQMGQPFCWYLISTKGTIYPTYNQTQLVPLILYIPQHCASQLLVHTPEVIHRSRASSSPDVAGRDIQDGYE